MVELLLIQSLFKARVFDQLSGGGRQSIHAFFEHNIDVYLLIVVFTLSIRHYSAQTSLLQSLMTQNPASKSADPFFFRSEQKESVQRNQLKGPLGLDVSIPARAGVPHFSNSNMHCNDC